MSRKETELLVPVPNNLDGSPFSCATKRIEAQVAMIHLFEFGFTDF